MSPKYNRRDFIKLSTAAAAGSAVVFSGFSESCVGPEKDHGIRVWGNPGGDVLSSPDYLVTIRKDNKTWTPFVYYTCDSPVDKYIDTEGDYIKLSFLASHSREEKTLQKNLDTYAHSWGNFDFSGVPVEVEVKILRSSDDLVLPLKSCRVFPSVYGISCSIISDDTIRFTMDKPAKIAIVPNWEQAMKKLEKAERKCAFDGYRNPLFLFARSPETEIPDKNEPGTLVIKPGEQFGMSEIEKAKTIWFEPGVHDYSEIDPDDPLHYFKLKTGQSVYLAGGSFVYAVFSSDVRRPVSEMPLIYGRGTFSAKKQPWSGVPYVTTVEKNVSMNGINITDPHNHISHSVSIVKDVTVVGAWHGNTDGFTREMPEPDPYTGWLLEDCFVMAADTNLKVGGYGKVKNYTIWQLGNSEPLWLRSAKNIEIDGLNIITYNLPPVPDESGQVINFSRNNFNNKNTIVRNVMIEAPFIPRIFLLTSIYDGNDVAYENILFENITVNTQHIRYKSPVGFARVSNVKYGRIVFRNMVINGTRITGENCHEYFELLNGVTEGKEVVFEQV